MTPATQILLFGKPFRITDYFRMGQIGWHWQIDDPLKRVGIPYEWTDTAGTTPVTAVGQGIGLLLGREYGGATGPSLLANGATGLTGTATAASYSTTTFAGSVSRAGDASNQSWVTWTGLTTSAVYRLRITNTGATSLDVRNGGVAGTIVASIAAGASTWVHPATTGGSTSITITATANSTTATFTLGQFAVLPGTHLTQATGTAKPTLSARVNLFLVSEQFDSTTWAKTSATVTANATTDPLGGSTADKLVEVAASSQHQISQVPLTTVSGATYRVRVYAKAAERQYFDITTGGPFTVNPIIRFGLVGAGTTTVRQGNPAATNVSITALANGWYLCSMDVTPNAAAGLTVAFALAPDASSSSTYLGDGTSGLHLWGADLRTADDAAKNIPAYQRVGATATDHDTDGFPHYAEGDGTDNCWASVATVDGSGSDKLAHVTAVTKVSDAATAVVHEHGATVLSNVGTVLFQTATATDWSINAYAGTLPGALVASPYAAPKTSVVAGVFDIASDLRQIHVDGVLKNTSNTDYGSGNFANATLYVLARGGSSLRFNGRFYGSTGRFGPMGDSERNNLTRWWMKRIGTA